MAEKVTAAAVTPVIRADQTQVLDDFCINAHLNTGTLRTEVLTGARCRSSERIPDLEVAFDARDFKVETAIRIYRNLGDKSGLTVGTDNTVLVPEIFGALSSCVLAKAESPAGSVIPEPPPEPPMY